MCVAVFYCVRTPGTGLYANLEKYSIPYPEAIFNIDYFSNDPQPFFSLAKALYPGSHRPNYIHYFIRTLHLKGLLLRTYTQNIDGLEKRESSAASKNCKSMNLGCQQLILISPPRAPHSVRPPRGQAGGGSRQLRHSFLSPVLHHLPC